MIECDYFYDAEHNGFNARVQEHPEVSASSGGWGAPLGTMAHMLEILTESWNTAFPEDLKTADDFHMNETDPWQGGPEDILTVRMPGRETPPE